MSQYERLIRSRSVSDSLHVRLPPIPDTYETGAAWLIAAAREHGLAVGDRSPAPAKREVKLDPTDRRELLALYAQYSASTEHPYMLGAWVRACVALAGGSDNA